MKIPTLLVGTANRHKLAEIGAILDGLPVRLLDARALPEPVNAREDGGTFEENASQKVLQFALAAARLPLEDRPLWALSDDSGLCVDALDGGPGVTSARYAGPERSDDRNNRKLLEALTGVPPEQRGASFVCVIACAEVPRGTGEPRVLLTARGECRGVIGDALRGRGGFGYDPLFFIPGLGKTYAELSEAEKNRISHRGRALLRFREAFRPLLEGAPAGQGAHG